MNRILCFCGLFLLGMNTLYPQSKSGLHRVFVIGNLADIPDEELLSYSQGLRQLLTEIKDPFTLIYSGDLSNQKNFDQNALNYDSIRISTFLEAADFPNGRQLLIPGDRDWLNSGEDGWKYVQTLEKIIERRFPRVKWIPGKGCPGPKDILLDEHLILLAVNTQFWNHPFERPTPTEAECSISRDGDFVEALEDLIEEAGNRNVLLTGHMPLLSNGIYGGKSSPKRNIFPFTDKNKHLLIPMPIIGSLYAAYRQNVGNKLDLINERFNPIRETLLNIMAENRHMIYLSGHEKNIQVLKFKENFFINSGAAFEGSFVRKDPSLLLASKSPGILELRYHKDARVNIQLYNFAQGTFSPSNPLNLLNSPCTEADTTQIPNTNKAYIPCKPEPKKNPFSFPLSGMCTAQGGKEYKASGFKTLMLGKLYRKSWTKYVTAPFLSLDDSWGGLEALERGGGIQTQSLKFRANNRKEYVFRSIDKNPVKALPLEFRTRFFSSLVKQATATQHPYGAIAVDKLLNHTDILHVHPELYIMPDDPRLGVFQDEFSGVLGMLEEKPLKAKGDRPASFEAEDIVRSYELFRKLYADHLHRIDVDAFLKSRIFDIWIGDRGRHEDNFKWAMFKQGDISLYKPIPRDRDHAFSVLDGFLPWLIDRPWALPFFEDFDYHIKDLRSLNYSARHLDRFILGAASKDDWIREVRELKRTFDEEKIRKAILAMPKEVYELSGKEIVEKLIKRLEKLEEEVLKYYEILAKEVNLVGSNKREYFKVIRNIDGSVEVKMYDLASFEDRKMGSRLFLARRFMPEETEEIRIYGLGSKDIIDISGNALSSIKIRALGGDGQDYISDKSQVQGIGKKTLVYEKNRKSIIELGSEGKQLHPRDQMLYDYRRKAFRYHSYHPLPVLSYTSAEGIKGGWGYQFIRRSFGKEKYAHKHAVSLYASTQDNFGLIYRGKFRQLIREWDLQIQGEWARPDRYNNFFGLGNETRLDDSLLAANFYRSRNQTFNLSAGLHRTFWRKSLLSFDIRMEKNDSQETDNNILSLDKFENLLGIDDLLLLQAQLALNLDFRDHNILPERGMQFYLSHRSGYILTNSKNYGLSEAYMSWYGTTHSIKHPLTLGIRIGAGDGYGEIPFYNKFALGQRENLHGYRRRRFTGDAMMYLNSELRFQVGKGRALIPITYGLTGFWDKGRVFLDGEESTKWHHGYGLGCYIIPGSRNLSLQFAFSFSEESNGLFLFTLGSLLR
ncbi:MAG: BamA/TamA family outer membrane protein [Bacteroidota bacterium]